MKQLFLSLLIVFWFSGFSQVTVEILPKNLTVCYGSNARFQAFLAHDTVSYIFTWKRNNVIIPNTDTLGNLIIPNVSYTDTGYYCCSVSSQYDTAQSDTVHLHIQPKLTIDTLYRYNELGCPGICKGQMKVLVSGGNPPYNYDWGAGHSQDTIVFSLCKGKFMLTVTDADNSHCVSREYTIDVLKLPKVTFTMTDPETHEPRDTIYLTKPYLNVAFPDTSTKNLTNWEWNFGDSTRVANVNPLQHTYTKTGRFKVSLNYTDLNGCDTTITDSITVKLAKLRIPNVFSPNHDGKNECFVIQEWNDKTLDINQIYLSNELIIVNRWGKKVFQASNYKSKDVVGEGCEGWDGTGLADGVYFYVLTCHGLYEDDLFKGSISIVR